jgi:hypothetical protein
MAKALLRPPSYAHWMVLQRRGWYPLPGDMAKRLVEAALAGGVTKAWHMGGRGALLVFEVFAE